MKMMRNIVLALCIAFMVMMTGCLAEDETAIMLGERITVNGETIAQDASETVYLDIRVEEHGDVPEELKELENRVVTIVGGGTYRISGKAQDIQIRVEADTDDEVRLILDGADITCRTAPAIAVISAADPREAGKYDVTIELERGLSRVFGAHTEETDEDETKLSGAITSLVSLGFEGEGFLDVNGDNEGIEVKFGHMTFNGGNIIVNSGDDPLNASEDGVSVITVNDGTLHLQAKPDKGGEGDGMDSNGSIVINGGSISAFAHPDSMDSGIDSDLGCTINGGIVLGAGNMYDEISADSGQLFMALQFAQKVQDRIVVTDTNGILMAVAHLPEEGAYSSFVFSSPELPEGDYYLYLGGELEMRDGEMQYTPGRQLQHGGSFGGRMSRGGKVGMVRPEDMPDLPEGMEKPEDMPEPPKGMQRPDRQMREDFEGAQNGGIQRFGGVDMSAEASTTFHLAPGSTMFVGITAAE